MKKNKFSATVIVILAMALVFAAMAIVTYYPDIEYARRAIPRGLDIGEACGCTCIRESRPWYGQMNYWKWLWLGLTPFLVFSVWPDAPRWLRGVRMLGVIVLGYVLVNLGTHLSMEIRNAPFLGRGVFDNSSERDKLLFSCFDVGDGAKFVFALFFGWIYAAVYAGWWEIVWNLCHRKVTGLIGREFKGDWVSRVVVFISMAVTIFIAILVLMRLYG